MVLDNRLGSGDNEKITSALKLLDGLENFDIRYFELDIESARENIDIDFVGREEEMENLIGEINTERDKTRVKVTSVDNMLGLIMREFGVAEINGDVEATVAPLIATYDGEDCSLLLDGADSLLMMSESQRKFVGFLAKVQEKENPKVHVIITSRSSIMSGPGQGDVPAIKPIVVNLEMLEDSVGTDLVQGLVGKGNITQDEAREVCKRCKGLPLAITIACGMIRMDHLRPSESLITDINNIRDLMTAVVSTLGKDLLAMLKLVSVFAGPFTVKSACTIIGQPDQQSRVWDHLRELRARRLIKAGSHSIDGSGAVRYDTHDEVRTFMSTLVTHAVTPEDMAAAKYRFMKLYEERVTTVAQDMQRNINNALDTFKDDVDNFSHFLALIQQETQKDYDWRRKERDDQHTWLMDTKAEEVGDRGAVHILLEQMMVVKDRISFYTGQAERLETQDTQMHAEMLCWLAETYLQVNMQQEAWGRLEEARKALEARPDRKDDSVQLSFARYHYVSGIYFSHRDDYKQNVRHLEQALKILTAKMVGNHVLHARVVNSLGFAHHNHAKTKRGQEYLGLLQESLAMHKKAHDIIIVGQDKHFDCCTYLMNIGVVHLDMGWHYKRARQATEANQHFNKALETFCDAERLVKAMDMELDAATSLCYTSSRQEVNDPHPIEWGGNFGAAGRQGRD
ncbi:hypothetical protein Bbelb_360930 [Branchiostoma belcheri]|nr:hypothetical protein Bbelb_360930 [Branchiostoma belcheri]